MCLEIILELIYFVSKTVKKIFLHSRPILESTICSRTILESIYLFQNDSRIHYLFQGISKIHPFCPQNNQIFTCSRTILEFIYSFQDDSRIYLFIPKIIIEFICFKTILKLILQQVWDTFTYSKTIQNLFVLLSK